MSSNVTFLALGMVLAGRLTDAVGPRWVWAAAAVLSAMAAVVGFTLARRAAEMPSETVEPVQAPVEPEPEAAVEAHGRTRQRAI